VVHGGALPEALHQRVGQIALGELRVAGQAIGHGFSFGRGRSAHQARAGAGARTTAPLWPPNPNDVDRTVRGDTAWASPVTRSASGSSGSSRFRVGGTSPVRRDWTARIASTTPDAPSR